MVAEVDQFIGVGVRALLDQLPTDLRAAETQMRASASRMEKAAEIHLRVLNGDATKAVQNRDAMNLMMGQGDVESGRTIQPLRAMEAIYRERERIERESLAKVETQRKAMEDRTAAYARKLQMETVESGVFGSMSGKQITKVLLGGGIAEFAGRKLNEMFDGIVQGIKEANEAGEDLIHTANAIAQSFLKSLPVAGQFFSLGQKIRNLFTGELDEVGKIEDGIKKQNEQLERKSKILEGLQRFNSTFDSSLGQSRVDIIENPIEKIRAQLAEDRKKLQADTDAMRKQAAQITDPNARSARQQEIDEYQRNRDQKMAQDASKAIGQEEIRQGEKAEAEWQRARDLNTKIREAKRAEADDQARLESELTQKTLENQGDELAAKLEAIKEYYRERMAAAREGEKGVLKELEAADIASAMKGDTQRRPAGIIDSIQTAIGSFRSAQGTKVATEDEQKKNTKAVQDLLNFFRTSGVPIVLPG